MVNVKKIIISAMCASMMLFAVGCSNSAEQTFVSCNSMDDAYLETEIWMDTPPEIGGYGDRIIGVAENKKAIQVLYEKQDGSDEICIRKAKGKKNPSSDTTAYTEESTISPFGIEITVKGSDNKINVASWIEDKFVYSVTSKESLTEEQLKDLVMYVTGEAIGC